MNLNNCKFSITKNNFVYVYEISNNNIFIKRISCDKCNRKIDFINIIDSKVEIYSINYKDGKKYKYSLSTYAKDIILENIFKILKNSLVKDFVNLDDIFNKIKSSYINYLISDNIIALSKENKNNNIIDIVLLENNEIIGNIKLEENINIIVDDYYKNNVLSLIKNYLCLFNKEEKYTKKLINNS